MHNRKYGFRLAVVTLFFIILLTLISFRLIYIQIILHNRLHNLAKDQHYITIELSPRRGTILDRGMRELAVDLRVDSIYAVARDVKEKDRTASLLAPILKKDKAFLYRRLSRDKLFVWLARRVSYEQAQRIKGLNLKGIFSIDESKRFYPNGSLACQTIGFAGVDNVGLDGIERYYDSYLRGKSGSKTITRDAKGRQIPAFEGRFIPPQDGYALVLTMDEVIQHIAERALKRACKKHNAKAGIAMVMSPITGDILALAVEPSYDLNNFSKAAVSSRKNRAISDYYEPGSIFKVLTASACLDKRIVSLNDKFFCENGAWYVAGHVLHDHQKHATLSFREVIEKSSNIGTVKAAIKLGDNNLYNYIIAYGFGSLTGIDLLGEISGKIRPLNRWTKYSITAIPMGQEVAVTPIQMLACISVVANGGLLVRPHLLSKILDSKGEVIKEYKPIVVRRVISEETAAQLRSVLKGAVEEGTGKMARLEEYEAAGKTGTSQKVEGGVYSHSKFVASFIGFAPADKPVISVCVMIDEPHPAYFGGVVSAPVFKEIADEVLRYMEVEPPADDKELTVKAKIRAA